LFLLHLDALAALERWSEIKQLLESEHFPLDEVAQFMYLARCSERLGEKTASANNWQRALEATQGDSPKLMALAEYAEKNGANEIAEVAYGSATNASPKLRAAWQGRVRIAQASGDTKKMHDLFIGMLRIWPNDNAIQNDEAYTRLLLLGRNQDAKDEGQETADRKENAELQTLSREGSSIFNPQFSTLNEIAQLAERLVEQNPHSLPHRTLLALARLRENRPTEALGAYANIQFTPNAMTPSALAVHAAVLAANGRANDAKTETGQIKVDNLLPEEKALIQNL
jgi:cytochrome c-type biogenesis protein CcmH/NrfG